MNEIELNGCTYVLKSSSNHESMRYVLVRSEVAGVFTGYLKSEEAHCVVLEKCRRIWYWSGAASLSQLAMEGVKDPDNCKFPCEVDSIKIRKVIEILDMPESARLNIAAVPVWKS